MDMFPTTGRGDMFPSTTDINLINSTQVEELRHIECNQMVLQIFMIAMGTELEVTKKIQMEE